MMAGTNGERKRSMEPELFDYGIQTEDSDIRAHVSVTNRAIYVFQTSEGLLAVERHQPPERPAYQDGVRGATAIGWLVRPDWISGLRKVPCDNWPGWHRFLKPGLSTSDKGALAVECVTSALRSGAFPLWIEAEESGDKSVQIAGTDIVVCCKKRIQVKCDSRCGERPLGTGNLFLQRAERNPLRRR